jgi:hypothetical protein
MIDNLPDEAYIPVRRLLNRYGSKCNMKKIWRKYGKNLVSDVGKDKEE